MIVIEVVERLPIINPPRPGVTIIGLYAHGGITRCHDYLMSDGSIATLYDHETKHYRAPALEGVAQ